MGLSKEKIKNALDEAGVYYNPNWKIQKFRETYNDLQNKGGSSKENPCVSQDDASKEVSLLSFVFLPLNVAYSRQKKISPRTQRAQRGTTVSNASTKVCGIHSD